MLERELGYVEVRRRGSHASLQAPGFPSLTISVHGGKDVSGHLVRTILVNQVGLSLAAAKELINRA